MKFDELVIGGKYSESRVVTAEDVEAFARISGDCNPLHLDEAFAATTMFKRRIAHGMLIASYISAAAGMKYPGKGTIYMQQTLKFMRPVYIGDEVTVFITTKGKQPEKKRVELLTEVFNAEGKIVVTGEALVKLEE